MDNEPGHALDDFDPVAAWSLGYDGGHDDTLSLLGGKVAELRIAASILDAEPDENILPIVRAYWEGIARGMRLACAVMLDEVLSDAPTGDSGGDDGSAERGER